MATKDKYGKGELRVSATTEELLLAAQQRGDESLETGRYVITFREGAVEDGLRSLEAQGLRMANARDFKDQAVRLQDVSDADALLFPEIGSALVGGAALQARGMSVQDEISAEGPVQAIEPEYFAFADNREYLRGFVSAANAIARDLAADRDAKGEVEAKVLDATWGLARCEVPASVYSGTGIKVAVLDTGMDLNHPDFAGRSITAQTFVGQPVQDLHSHGTHCIGTACGPKEPSDTTPRYGIAYGAQIFAGKVLNNSGTGTTGSILAGINWAIANGCQVISMSLGSQSSVQTAYTKAGYAALDKGCLIIAAAGNESDKTGAPANSPTIMSVASLDQDLSPSYFSNYGKIEIAAPGRDIFSSVPLPVRYGTKSGTSMAAPHVAGCAALWAETSPTLRGMKLWQQLQSSAFKLPFPPSPVSRFGSGLVQAP